MNRKMIGEAIYIRVSDRKYNPIATKRRNVSTQSWSGKSAVFLMEERSDVPRFQQVEQKAVGWQRNLGLRPVCITGTSKISWLPLIFISFNLSLAWFNASFSISEINIPGMYLRNGTKPQHCQFLF